jgi:hypothetical protein
VVTAKPASTLAQRDLLADAPARLKAGPTIAYLGALAIGWAAMLAVDLPGHLTLDSLVELYEGRFRIRQSWAPPFYAWVLGVFDRLSPGVGLYIVASAAMLFVALASFPWLRGGRANWGAAALAALFCASPLMLIYQGEVWKDVLFANAAIVGMTALAWALRDPDRVRSKGPALAAALLLLAASALLRQNGVVVAVAAAAALAWVMGRRGWRRGLAWGLGALVAVVALSHVINIATQPRESDASDGMDVGLRILQGYDILGALTAEPLLPLPRITADAPDAIKTLRQLGPRYYSAERTDMTDGQPQVRDALADVSSEALAGDWTALILQRPGLYLRVRAPVFSWVFLTPQIDRCLPVALGVQGPQDTVDALGLRLRWSETDDRLLQYDRAFLKTPVHSHPFYALLALAVGIVLLRRREPADIVMAALMGSALAFAASFFLISIACDFRYLYFLDLAAMAGALYVALDPPWRRRAVAGARMAGTPCRSAAPSMPPRPATDGPARLTGGGRPPHFSAAPDRR